MSISYRKKAAAITSTAKGSVIYGVKAGKNLYY